GVDVPDDSQVLAVELYMSQTSWYPDRVLAAPVTVSGVATVSVSGACDPGVTVAGSAVATGVVGGGTRGGPAVATPREASVQVVPHAAAVGLATVTWVV